MRTKVSTKGQIVLPGPLRRRLDIRAGDSLEISVEQDRIVLTQASKPKYEARIVEDPVTGLRPSTWGRMRRFSPVRW